MNDIAEVGEKMLRWREPRLNNLSVESSVYGL